MAANTVTMQLEGDIRLTDFSQGISHLTGLLSELGEYLVSNANIEWIVEDLEVGSALLTAVGIADDPTDVERVISAYHDVGDALANSRPIGYSSRIEEHARGLANLLDGRITAIRFVTEFGDTMVTSGVAASEQEGLHWAAGQVRGTVETLSHRGRLKFTLYDSAFDRAIRCFLTKGQEDKIREAWGKHVVVTGRIGRDPDTGQAMLVRQITDIEIYDPPDPDSYKEVRGLFGPLPVNESSVEAIRRMRDAWSDKLRLLG